MDRSIITTVNIIKTDKGRQTQDKIMSAIVRYIEEHGYPPSIREIGDIAGIKSTSTVFSHMQALFNEGRLETDAGMGTPRAIRVPGYKFVKED